MALVGCDAFAITATGLAEWHAATTPNDVLPWLASRKSRKFMGKQDMLAVIAAGRALEACGLRAATAATTTPARTVTGIYLTVGHIPFERDDIDAMASHSVDDAGAFDVRRFAADGIAQVNPLLTFRCLPNMPSFHVSQNFGITGPYVSGYAGVAQAAQGVMLAIDDLAAGAIDVALVGGVADQCNFLVDTFFGRDAARAALPRSDIAAMVVIERRGAARQRGVKALAVVEASDVVVEMAVSQVAVSQIDADSPGCDAAPPAPHNVGAADLFVWLHREAQRNAPGVHTFIATSLEGARVGVTCRFGDGDVARASG